MHVTSSDHGVVSVEIILYTLARALSRSLPHPACSCCESHTVVDVITVP